MVVSFVHWFRIEAIAFVQFTEFSIVVFRCGFTCFSVLSSAIRMVETCLGGAWLMRLNIAVDVYLTKKWLSAFNDQTFGNIILVSWSLIQDFPYRYNIVSVQTIFKITSKLFKNYHLALTIWLKILISRISIEIKYALFEVSLWFLDSDIKSTLWH